MINGAHVIIYSKDVEADRAFFKDVLGFNSVDVGGGWLIVALPPAEVACHPGEENDQHELYLMCENLNATIAALDAKGIQCTDVQEPPLTALGDPDDAQIARRRTAGFVSAETCAAGLNSPNRVCES